MDTLLEYLVLAVAALTLLAVGLFVWIGRLRQYQAAHPHTANELLDARRTSVRQSRSVTSGKVQEHLAPLLPAFAERFNLREARFLGAPVDYIVFEGLEDGVVERVTLVEIKTSSAQLTARERAIRDAVHAGRVGFETIRLAGEVPAIPDG